MLAVAFIAPIVVVSLFTITIKTIANRHHDRSHAPSANCITAAHPHAKVPHAVSIRARPHVHVAMTERLVSS